MRSEYLEVFLSIVDAGSISGAAARLHMAQSNVSTVLRTIEQETGHTLIRRTRGQRAGLVPTEEGFLFCEYAKGVLDRYDQTLLAMEQLHTDVASCLQLSTGQTLSVTLLNGILKGFSKSNPSIQVNVKVVPLSTIEDVHRAFEEGRCNFVVATHPLADERFVSERFLEDPIVLICSRSLKIGTSLTLWDLKNLPLVFREPTCATMTALSSSMEKIGSSLRELSPVMTVYGASAVREAVKYGALCGFVPLTAYRPNEDVGHIRIIPVEGFDGQRAVYLVYRKNVRLSPEARLLRRFILSSEWRSEFAL